MQNQFLFDIQMKKKQKKHADHPGNRFGFDID